ncbi:MAG TPA: hypothetical protein VHX86_07615 [Tepidisphaeraceae bacterium]|jgi:hypothetical protein|nr:hypothetical protein [Tepidisphaeraceae bacterium]
MATYIVSCDVGSDGDIDGLLNAINRFAESQQVTNFTWAVVTNTSAKEIRDRLGDFIGQQGHLFVVKSGIEGAWRRSLAPNEWLKEHL